MKNSTFNPYASRFTPSSHVLKKLSKTPFEADIHEYSFLGIHGVDLKFESKPFTFNPNAPRFTPSSHFLKKLSKTPFEADPHEYSFFRIHGVDEVFAKPKPFTFNPNAPRFIPQRLNKPAYSRPVLHLPPAERVFWFQVMQQESADEEYYQVYLKNMTKESRS